LPYAPLYFASAVLPDGRVLVEGGEYVDFNFAWTNQGAIYDPVIDSWQTVQPPVGWGSIGDAQGVVLSSGTFMLADCRWLFEPA
jgi:Kelch motif